MKITKKIILSIGTMATVVAPISAVVACGETSNDKKNNEGDVKLRQIAILQTKLAAQQKQLEQATANLRDAMKNAVAGETAIKTKESDDLKAYTDSLAKIIEQLTGKIKTIKQEIKDLQEGKDIDAQIQQALANEKSNDQKKIDEFDKLKAETKEREATLKADREERAKRDEIAVANKALTNAVNEKLKDVTKDLPGSVEFFSSNNPEDATKLIQDKGYHYAFKKQISNNIEINSEISVHHDAVAPKYVTIHHKAQVQYTATWAYTSWFTEHHKTETKWVDADQPAPKFYAKEGSGLFGHNAGWNAKGESVAKPTGQTKEASDEQKLASGKEAYDEITQPKKLLETTFSSVNPSIAGGSKTSQLAFNFGKVDTTIDGWEDKMLGKKIITFTAHDDSATGKTISKLSLKEFLAKTLDEKDAEFGEEFYRKAGLDYKKLDDIQKYRMHWVVKTYIDVDGNMNVSMNLMKQRRYFADLNTAMTMKVNTGGGIFHVGDKGYEDEPGKPKLLGSDLIKIFSKIFGRDMSKEENNYTSFTDVVKYMQYYLAPPTREAAQKLASIGIAGRIKVIEWFLKNKGSDDTSAAKFDDLEEIIKKMGPEFTTTHAGDKTSEQIMAKIRASKDQIQQYVDGTFVGNAGGMVRSHISIGSIDTQLQSITPSAIPFAFSKRTIERLGLGYGDGQIYKFDDDGNMHYWDGAGLKINGVYDTNPEHYEVNANFALSAIVLNKKVAPSQGKNPTGILSNKNNYWGYLDQTPDSNVVGPFLGKYTMSYTTSSANDPDHPHDAKITVRITDSSDHSFMNYEFIIPELYIGYDDIAREIAKASPEEKAFIEDVFNRGASSDDKRTAGDVFGKDVTVEEFRWSLVNAKNTFSGIVGFLLKRSLNTEQSLALDKAMDIDYSTMSDEDLKAIMDKLKADPDASLSMLAGACKFVKDKNGKIIGADISKSFEKSARVRSDEGMFQADGLYRNQADTVIKTIIELAKIVLDPGWVERNMKGL